MKKKIIQFLCIVSIFTISGCGLSKYSSIQRYSSLDKYRFFYAIPTSQLASGYGFVLGGQSGTIGSSSSKSVNPADIINGYMMKRGFVRITELDENKLYETLIIAYGESGRHKRGLSSYAIEVTLQFIDASSNKVILTSTGAGMGRTYYYWP